jgi:hypothetical protein
MLLTLSIRFIHMSCMLIYVRPHTYAYILHTYDSIRTTSIENNTRKLRTLLYYTCVPFMAQSILNLPPLSCAKRQPTVTSTDCILIQCKQKLVFLYKNESYFS